MKENTNIAEQQKHPTDKAIPFDALVSLRPMLYKIHNEDCRATLAKLPAECIDLVVTSPPYDDLRTYKGHEWNFEIFTEIAKELFRVMKTGGVIVWVVSDATRNGSETGTSFRQALYFMEIGFNLTDTMIYRKLNGAMGSRYTYLQEWEYMFVISKGLPKTVNFIRDRKNVRSGIELQPIYKSDKEGRCLIKKKLKMDEYGRRKNIWDYPVGGKQEGDYHCAIFPEGLAEDHIRSWSNEGDVIYDPFSGSGTTCKVADRLGRAWFGSEIAEEYQSVALRRIENDLFTKASN